MGSVKSAALPGAILQIKIRLLDISPMIWRRVLVPESMSLRELNGVVQLAMGWEGIHLFEFAVRGVRYAGPDLSGMSTDVALSDFRFRSNAKFRYVYDMLCWWEHEIRVEQRLAAVPGKRYPQCVGGAGACPPEDCGGPDAYHARREEATGFDAMNVSGQNGPWLQNGDQCDGGSWWFGPRSERKGASANSDFHIRGVSSMARLAGCTLMR